MKRDGWHSLWYAVESGLMEAGFSDTPHHGF